MNMVYKAIITAAGLGTRLLPITKEMPKEMLPLFDTFSEKSISLKPVVQIIFELLYTTGFRDFCFVVGRGKRILEDYFTPDFNFIELLRKKHIVNRARELLNFYQMVKDSRIFFVNQPEPIGFGDAVLRAEAFIGTDSFLLHTGDNIILGEKGGYVNRLLKTFNDYQADAVILAEEIEFPRSYGVIVSKTLDTRSSILKVLDIVEKPAKPPSNIAVVAVYVFKPKIFEYIKRVKLDERGEIQLTDAIKMLIDDGGDVYAIKLKTNEKRLDIGTTRSYWKALYESYQWSLRRASRSSIK